MTRNRTAGRLSFARALGGPVGPGCCCGGNCFDVAWRGGGDAGFVPDTLDFGSGIRHQIWPKFMNGEALGNFPALNSAATNAERSGDRRPRD